jgi:hypothetical protein
MPAGRRLELISFAYGLDVHVSFEVTMTWVMFWKPLDPDQETEALRFGKLCGYGRDLWLNLQKRYDPHHAPHELGETIKKFRCFKWPEGLLPRPP